MAVAKGRGRHCKTQTVSEFVPSLLGPPHGLTALFAPAVKRKGAQWSWYSCHPVALTTQIPTLAGTCCPLSQWSRAPFFSFADEAFIRTVTRAGIFQQRIISISYVHFLCEHRYVTAEPGLLLCEVIYISVCRTGAKISQHWCCISTHFVLGSSCESPVGAVQRYLKGWYFCNYLIIAPRFFLVLVKPSFRWKCNPTLLNFDKMWLRININSPLVFGVGTLGLFWLFPVWKHRIQTGSHWIEWKVSKVVEYANGPVILL